jgi:hypothetical protein
MLSVALDGFNGSNDGRYTVETPGIFPSDFDCMQSVILDGFNEENDERYIVEDLLVLWKVAYDCETVLEPGELGPDSARSREEYSPLH